MACMNDFDDFILSRGIQLSLWANAVFDIRIDQDDPERYTCGYYIADHTTRTVFWLDTVEADSFPVWWEVKGVTSPTHIGKTFTPSSMFDLIHFCRTRCRLTILVSLSSISTLLQSQR